jgi:DNA modification methylase
MNTETRLFFENAASMEALADDSVDLVVTSPPYPMIEMWDAPFCALDPEIGACFDEARYETAFDRMHAALAEVWAECERVLNDGGLLCVNVGDATRTFDETGFRLWPNGARTQAALAKLGLDQLPGILWRKPTNSPTKFMGSGMIPPNAYATLEHERLLIFRKSGKRRVTRRDARYESAYFWEERNRWFSDVWTDLLGASQSLGAHENGVAPELRERSGAFPLALPLRLVLMFSIHGDRVLDPFLGTGTTALAAALTGRHAVGYEIDEAFRPAVVKHLRRTPSLSHTLCRKRLEAHRAFLREREKPCKYENEHYGFDVITKQERQLRLYDVTSVEETGADRFCFSYEPHHAQQEMFAVSEPEPA